MEWIYHPLVLNYIRLQDLFKFIYQVEYFLLIGSLDIFSGYLKYYFEDDEVPATMFTYCAYCQSVEPTGRNPVNWLVVVFMS